MGILLPIIMAITVLGTFYALSFAVFNHSWSAMLIASITSLPISLYFVGVNLPYSLVGFVPIIFLTLTVVIKRQTEKKNAY